MKHDNISARSRDCCTVSSAAQCCNISSAVERLGCQSSCFSCAESAGAKRQSRRLQLRLAARVAIITTLIVSLPSELEAAGVIYQCWVREGKTPIIVEKNTSRYERKLFVTPDEVARYVFLTNAPDDGDRSAAVYRMRDKRGSSAGDCWVTATVAADSVRGDDRNVRVRRFDAPLPASTANLVHDLWLAVLQHSPINEKAIPCAPTGVLSVATASGARLKAVTVSLDENCIALLELGESLIDYAKLTPSRRGEAARKIEKESQRLLRRVSQAR